MIALIASSLSVLVQQMKGMHELQVQESREAVGDPDLESDFQLLRKAHPICLHPWHAPKT